ncbi:LysR family transcriptional regulator [Marinivivus vitaminiproducens]|uniref:LysR family transcriptional regulator n=1 Tax=Marinivivus vitaminiproducens TaxID=3035935 RepID=UPI0027981198|nr:LysR family transcriptional regulator [Geminicoccaceae bacterium SCSIO 64248]
MPPKPAELTWDDFRLVKAIADARGLQGAATMLGMAHSTAFRRLGQIEEALGCVLFERHRSGYAVTAAGEEMAALGAGFDEGVTAFLRKAAGQELTPSGDLRVTTNDSLLVELLTPLFARFRAAYPDIRLDIVLANQALNLSRRDADVAIRATDHPPDTLHGRRVARIAWALYACADALGSPTPAGLDDLVGRDWVSLSDDFAMLDVVRFVGGQVPPERIVYKVNGVLGLAEAIEAGIGIGYLPCFIGETRPGLTRLASVNETFSADLWLLVHPDLRRSPRVRAFLDFMADALTAHRAFLEGRHSPVDAGA